MRATQYEIEYWDTTGVQRQRIVRDVEWFRPWTGSRSGQFATKPLGLCIEEDATGRLWVLINTNPATIEVIDPRSGQLLASRNLNLITPHIAGGIFAHARDLPDGTPVLDVYRLELHQQ
jgi:hypothetical protein